MVGCYFNTMCNDAENDFKNDFCDLNLTLNS